MSLRRRMLHGRIDILRAERERRRRGLHVDPADPGPTSAARRDEPCLLPGVRLPEPRGANYCARCGSYLRRDEQGETTLSLGPDELVEEVLYTLAACAPRARRPGRGRQGGRELRGRRPPDPDRPLADCHVFLDDVTVSRRHAEIVHEDDPT